MESRDDVASRRDGRGTMSAPVRLTPRGRMLAGLALALGLASLMAGLEGLSVMVAS